MRRRELLGGASGALASVALAGCSALFGSDGDDGVAESPTDRPTRRPTDREPSTPARTTRRDERGEGPDLEDDYERLRWNPVGEPVLRTTVGDPEAVPFPENTNPPEVSLWNVSLSRRTFRLALVDPGSGASRWSRTVTFPPESYVTIVVADPGDYDLVVYRDDGAVGVVAVEREDFDCNRTWRRVRLEDDGRVRSGSFSTMMGCPGPSVVAVDASSGAGECGRREQAWLVPRDGTLRLDGRVATPSPCYAVDEARAAYSPDDDRLRVTVVAERAGEDCRDCAGSVPYDVTVSLANAYPGAVVVDHRVGGETRRVETFRDVAP